MYVIFKRILQNNDKFMYTSTHTKWWDIDWFHIVFNAAKVFIIYFYMTTQKLCQVFIMLYGPVWGHLMKSSHCLGMRWRHLGTTPQTQGICMLNNLFPTDKDNDK